MDRVLPIGLLSSTIAALAMALAAPVAAKGLSGTYDSPLGKLRVVEKSGVVTGTFAGGKSACGYKPGKKVLEGTRLDDSVTGTLHACKLGDGCSGDLEGIVMLLVTQEGKLMSGAVHMETGKCTSPVGGDGITLKRAGTKTPVEQAAARAQKEPKPKGATGAQAKKNGHGKGTTSSSKNHSGGRPQAEKLAAEGQALFEAGEIEEARARFLQSVEVDPGYSQGYVGVGVTYYMRDRYDEALDYYKRGLEANPGNRDAYYNMACVYALKTEVEQALRYLRIAVLNGYVDTDTIGSDPDLKALHDNPEFQRLRSGQL